LDDQRIYEIRILGDEDALLGYPHPALLSLLNESFRVRYKIERSRQYWPDASVSNRIASLLVQFKRIHAALSSKLGDPGFRSPASEAVHTLSGLKRYEDALDALVSAWVGVEYVNGQAIPYGNDTAAVWIPQWSPANLPIAG